MQTHQCISCIVLIVLVSAKASLADNLVKDANQLGNGLLEVDDQDHLAEVKRRIFRYGRASGNRMFRYGRNADIDQILQDDQYMPQYGDGDNLDVLSSNDENNGFINYEKRGNAKRIFHWGKRAHIFRYGKRSDDLARLMDIKKLLQQQKTYQHKIENRNPLPKQGPHVPFRFGE